MNFPSSRFLLGALFSAWLALATGCGGGGGGSDSGGGSVANPVPPAGNNVAGPADPVQDTLLSLGEGVGDTPAVGDTAQELIAALASLLDAPDGLAGGFENFLTSQDPNDLISGGEDAGDALLSFAGGLSETLLQLTEEGEAIPGSEALIPTLTQLQEAVQDGVTGQTDGGDLTAVTDLLVQLSGQLTGLADQVPQEVQDAPLVGDLLIALGGGANDVAIILNEVGELDGDGTSAALVAAFGNVLDTLSGSLPGAGAALPDAVTDATETFQNGLAVVLNPLFQALRGVLAPVTGEDSPFAGPLGGLLALGGDGDGISGLGGLDGLSGLLAGGGMSSGGTDIPRLGDLLAGLPLLGDLLADLPGGDALGGGGLGALTTILDQGGTGDIPLLGDLLQGIPGLSDPGSSAPLGLNALTDLLTSLLSLNGDGLPIIGDVLDAADGGSGLDANVLGGILDDLLGDLLGMFGTDANGGFLDGTQGLLSLGGILGGLLGPILGPFSL